MPKQYGAVEAPSKILMLERVVAVSTALYPVSPDFYGRESTGCRAWSTPTKVCSRLSRAVSRLE